MFVTICLFLDCFFKLKISRGTKVELRGVSVAVRWEKGETKKYCVSGIGRLTTEKAFVDCGGSVGHVWCVPLSV